MNVKIDEPCRESMGRTTPTFLKVPRWALVAVPNPANLAAVTIDDNRKIAPGEGVIDTPDPPQEKQTASAHFPPPRTASSSATRW